MSRDTRRRRKEGKCEKEKKEKSHLHVYGRRSSECHVTGCLKIPSGKRVANKTHSDTRDMTSQAVKEIPLMARPTPVLNLL